MGERCGVFYDGFKVVWPFFHDSNQYDGGNTRLGTTCSGRKRRAGGLGRRLMPTFLALSNLRRRRETRLNITHGRVPVSGIVSHCNHHITKEGSAAGSAHIVSPIL
jgi:hypothetical protein